MVVPEIVLTQVDSALHNECSFFKNLLDFSKGYYVLIAKSELGIL